MKYNSLATNLSRKLTAAKSEHTRDVAATLDGTDWRFCDSILKKTCKIDFKLLAGEQFVIFARYQYINYIDKLLASVLFLLQSRLIFE